jgi:hypothetical protein
MKFAGAILTAMWICAMVYLGQQALPSRPPRPGVAQAGSTHRLAESMQRKLDHIRENSQQPHHSQQPHPDPTPTVMTEDEVNDYLASGKVQLPQGVKKVTLQGRSGVVEGFVNVDFDEIRAGQHSSNPLLGIFSGRHMVHVEGNASGSGGQGKVHVRNVAIDGVDVPRMALEFFVEKYITPKYPNVGLDSEFQLPNRIDMATVGYHKLTVTQR